MSDEVLTKLNERGRKAFKQQIAESGGAISESEAATLLGLPISEVKRQSDQWQLLAITFDGEPGYPVWQFNGNKVLTYFSEVMDILKPNTCTVGAVQFFLCYEDDLGNTPIGILKKGNPIDLEAVKLLARQFNQQLAR